ncbi:PAS domain S-box protein [Gaetbulibacter aestuarii]|uniref:histidine kinase n=1 Tax=Gaetbulibacter aestuarii TaxID=1502358 RepID=A0ABW7N205_9FLAO
MLQYQDFKQDYYKILQNQPEILDWLHQDMLHGVWYANFKFPKKIWVNDAFWKTLKYEASNEAECNSALRRILNSDFNTRIKSFFENVEKDPSNVCGTTTHYTSGINNLVTLKSEGFNVLDRKGHVTGVIIKFKRIRSQTEMELIRDLETLHGHNLIYEETNEVARVGGWAVSMENHEIFWSKVTKDIHEVDQDYVPELEGAINFFKEGWSRDLITKVFSECIEFGKSYDEEFKVITAKGNEIWVRAFGKAEFKGDQCVRVYGAFQDINEKKLREIELEKSQERFEKIFNNSSIGKVLVNSKGELQMVNDAALETFELKDMDRSKVMKLTYKDMIHPDYLEEANMYRKKLLAGEIDKYKMESRFITAKGKHIWCNINTSIIRSEDGSDDLIITQAEDITEIKNLEKESRNNSIKFKNVFEYSPIGMGVVTLDREWQMANKKLANIVGYTVEEFMELRFSEVTHPDDLKNDAEYLAEMLENKRDYYSVQKRYIHKNGQIVYGLLNVSCVRDEHGNISSLIGHVVDLTQQIKADQALKRSFNELQSLLNATTHVSIIETDLNGYARKFNKGAENLLGYSAHEMIGRSVALLHEGSEIIERGKELSEQYNTEISGFNVFVYEANQGHYSSGEWTYIRKDGSKFPVQLVATAIRNDKNKITGYLGVATDISELKAMESSLIDAKVKAESANKSKSEFLANMSHEIRTPLNGIIGFTDLLMRTKLSENQAKYMQTVQTSANALLELVNDILDFSKIEAGKLELNPEKTNLTDLCVQSLDIIKHQAHSKGLELLLNVGTDSRKMMYADHVRLRQILTNLLGNAVKFTKEGEIELKVDISEIPGNSAELQYKFSIRDTGVGIASNNLKKIFNAFDQEDGSTTRKYGGTGLGLTISNKLLHLMGSELQVESTIDKGSIFFFTVNFKTEEEESYKISGSNKIKNVLVVDDNATNRNILKEMLAVDGLVSTVVSSGIDAIDLLSDERNNFDLAIIDYHMPYLNGVELIKHIREDLKLDSNKLPIILLHSSGEDALVNKKTKTLQLEANIVKPIQINKLFSVISAILSQDKTIKSNKIEDKTSSDLAQLKCRVMIAEDNPVNKFLSKTIVEKVVPNCTIIEANDGQEAVELCKKQNPDLILMDIQMPNLSGYHATEIIRLNEKEGERIPIIALTARTLKGEKERCEQHGMDGYITKPVVLETIKKLIIEHIVEKRQKYPIK